MTPDEKQQYLSELKKRGQAAVGRADSLLADLTVESAKLKTDVKRLRTALTERLATPGTKEGGKSA